MSLDEDFAEFQESGDLKAALSRALRQLDEVKRKKAELVEAVYQAARDAASGVVLGKVKRPTLSKGSSKERLSGSTGTVKKRYAASHSETAISPLADWQLGKVTPTYSSEVCAERIATLGDKVAELTAIQRADHPVPDARVYLLGDLVEGELVFPGQAHRIDASLFAQVMLDGPQILGDYLRRLLGIFERVHVEGVIGNHGAIGGRSRKEMHPESNADTMMYEATRIRLAGEDRLTWGPTTTAGERHWFVVDEVRGNRVFLFHGDQCRGGFAGFPWYAFGRRLQGWNALYDFRYALSGHFHTPVRGYYTGGIIHWGSGSPESSNTYAAENMAASGSPSQWLLFMASHGVSAEYEVRL